jgi:tRNA nucleotidyltransferase (CCA-adding enzyme)
MTPKELEQLLQEIAQQITPTAGERQKVTRLLKKVQIELQQQFETAGVDCDIQIHGSIARDTWLRAGTEIDLFLVIPPPPQDQTIQHILDLVKAYLGPIWHEAYADHPYLQATIQGVQIDFVPCYRISDNDTLISAVDRSPLHTQFITAQLQKTQHKDVRLLKQFMHGTGLYGAEIRIGGFSGYLCELLILFYGSFLTTLQHVASWKSGEVLDINDQWYSRPIKAQQHFQAPLIVIDPVDAQRNVASAVTPQRMGEVITAANRFLQNPAKTYFFPDTENNVHARVESFVQHMQFDIIAISVTIEAPAPDILWGQLHRTRRAIAKYLHRHDFTIFTSGVWSDEQNQHIFVFSLASILLPLTKKHRGPPIDSPNVAAFVEKHLTAPDTSMGPWIDNDRWYVGKTRQYANARTLLTEQLTADGGKAIGVANGFRTALKTHHTINVNQEIIHLGLIYPSFLHFFHRFLQGRPAWLH